MKRRNFLKISSQSTLLIGMAPVITPSLLPAPKIVVGAVFENDYYKYEIGSDGRNLHFYDKTTGKNYINNDSPSNFASIIKEGREYKSTLVSQTGNNTHIEFQGTNVSVDLLSEVRTDHIKIELVDFKGTFDTVTFINVSLRLEAMPYESFAACILSLNLQTHVKELPVLQSQLAASCYERFSLKGSSIALIGIPTDNILPTVRNVIKEAKEIPLSTTGGAWAMENKEGYGSYIMNFGTLTEDTVDEWIGNCKKTGFNQVDNHGGNGFFTFGDFILNKEKWPDGWDNFKRINKRLHDAGISSIFHTYAFFIEKESSFVTPVPSPDLGYFGSFTLSDAVGENDAEIHVIESTVAVSTTIGFFVRNSTTLRIGEELIEFTGVSDKPPYKFTGCKRGVNGTKSSAHKINEKAFHLKQLFGMFVAGNDTALMKEIARRISVIVNDCGFDGLYFDAIDGSDILAGTEDSWYYSTRFVFDVAKNLTRSVGMEFSTMKHHWWHYRSRWQAWDTPVRGYKRFIDIHSASIKTNEYEHGLWQGHYPLIKKFAAAENGRLMLPLHFGWWVNRTWNPPQQEPTFTDDIEYLCCKMIGNNAGLSMQEVNKEVLEDKPLFKQLVAIIRQYEELRHKKYFNSDIKKLLRQPGKEFKLIPGKDSTWNFKPVKYEKRTVTVQNDTSFQWKLNNEFSTQPVKLRIEPLMSMKSYNDPGNIVLSDFTDANQFGVTAAKGVSGSLKKNFIPGHSIGHFRAYNEGLTQKEGAWIKAEKIFDEWMNLENNQGLGVWVYGDGRGELLNFRIESPVHLSNGARGDHFVKIDFKGWKYFELVELESTEFSNYKWPASDFYVYDSYRHSIQYKNISKFQLWYNNLAEKRSTEVLIRPVKAIELIAVNLENPVVCIAGKKIMFPVNMVPGDYLEFHSGSECYHYNSNGEILKQVSTTGEIPVLKAGTNNIEFSCNKKGNTSIRAQVTIISEGQPL